MTSSLWVAVALTGAATLAARLLPLLWRGRTRETANAPGWLNALGPCLLTAMAVAVLLPKAVYAIEGGRIMAFFGGAGAAATAMALRRDPGLAALAGVAGWWLASAL